MKQHYSLRFGVSLLIDLKVVKSVYNFFRNIIFSRKFGKKTQLFSPKSTTKHHLIPKHLQQVDVEPQISDMK